MVDTLMSDRVPELDPKLARAARQDEIDEFRRRRVYTVVPRSSMRPGAKIVGVRWVETDTGIPGAPKVRCRLVAQEFATEADPDGELFAPTPPLAATRWLISWCCFPWASRARR